jgi:hypothetical protein
LDQGFMTISLHDGSKKGCGRAAHPKIPNWREPVRGNRP